MYVIMPLFAGDSDDLSVLLSDLQLKFSYLNL